MTLNFFYSALLHAIVLFYIVTFPIFGGSLQPEHYSYVSVSLTDSTNVGVRGTREIASKITPGGTKKTRKLDVGTAKKHPVLTKRQGSGHHEVKQTKIEANGPERENQHPPPHQDTSTEVGKKFSGAVEKSATGKEREGKNNVSVAVARAMYPFPAARTEQKGGIEAIVPDLPFFRQVPLTPRQTDAGILRKAEMPVMKSSTTGEAPVPKVMKPAESAGAPPEPHIEPGTSPVIPAKAAVEAAEKPAVPAVEHSSTVINAPPKPVAEAQKNVLPPVPAATDLHISDVSPPPVSPQGIGKDDTDHDQAKESEAQSPPQQPVVLAVPPPVPPSFEPNTGQGEVSFDEEISSAVTGIGETTYVPTREKAVTLKPVNKSGGREQAKASEGHNPPQQPVVLAVPPLVPPSLKTKNDQGKISLDEEISSAVTRIGETTYGPTREKAVALKPANKSGGQEQAKASEAQSPPQQPVMLAVPPLVPPSLKPGADQGALLAKGPAGADNRMGAPMLSTSAQIHGMHFVSAGGMGKAVQGREAEPPVTKKESTETVPGFPLPEAFFMKDIKIHVSLKEPAMPEVSMKLWKRPFTDGESGESESDHRVVLKEEKEKIMVGGRVNTEETLAVAKADKGIYTFVMKNEGTHPCEADVAFILYGGGEGGRTKTYEGSHISAGSAIAFKFILPQAVFWDDRNSFTGSIEDSDSITKFNDVTGLVWKEKKDY